MKWFFFILLLANLVLAAWGGFARQPQSNPLARQEINADKIKIVQPLAESTPLPQMPLAESAPLPQMPQAKSAPQPAQAPVPPPVKKACYRWGIFSGDAIEKARQALKTLTPPGAVSERGLPKSGKLGYWAYIPPKKTRQEAIDTIKVLDELGIKDHFLIPDSGKWQYAISLGIFSTDTAARKYAAMLHQRGVKSAVSGRRDSGEIEFLISSTDASLASGIRKLDFPKTQLDTIDCSAIAGTASRD